MTKTPSALLNPVLGRHTPQGETPIQLPENITINEIKETLFTFLNRVLNQVGFTVNLNGATTLETLTQVKSEIQEAFNTTLSAYQKPLRETDKLDKQILVIRGAKKLSETQKQERITALLSESQKLVGEALLLKPVFLAVRRSEEYFRIIPDAYRIDTPEVWSQALHYALLADSWNPNPTLWRIFKSL